MCVPLRHGVNDAGVVWFFLSLVVEVRGLAERGGFEPPIRDLARMAV